MKHFKYLLITLYTIMVVICIGSSASAQCKLYQFDTTGVVSSISEISCDFPLEMLMVYEGNDLPTAVNAQEKQSWCEKHEADCLLLESLEGVLFFIVVPQELASSWDVLHMEKAQTLVDSHLMRIEPSNTGELYIER